ncbi:MAG: hypothetical protein AAF633_16565 [Chloroflexota bacterium]
MNRIKSNEFTSYSTLILLALVSLGACQAPESQADEGIPSVEESAVVVDEPAVEAGATSTSEPTATPQSTATATAEPEPSPTATATTEPTATAETGIPNGTADFDVIIGYLDRLVELEQAPLQENSGWFHTAYIYASPEGTGRDGEETSQGSDTSIPTADLIPENPLSESYVFIDEEGNPLEMISGLRRQDTGEWTQLMIWDGETTVATHLKAAGFPSSEYELDIEPNLFLFTQSTVDELKSWPTFSDFEFLTANTQTEGTLFKLSILISYPESRRFANVPEPVTETITDYWFDTASGQLISAQNMAILESGEMITLWNSEILTQAFVPELPEEIKELYIAHDIQLPDK